VSARRHQLVTFLGKGREPGHAGYRNACYQLPDGAFETTPFIGLALARQLTPDSLIVLGTCGSMWDVLIEHLTDSHEAEDVRVELIDAVEAGAVTQPLLERVTPLVSCALQCQVRLRLIPYARDLAEQTAILQDLAETVEQGRVSFDLTHGFRHLGMLGLVSAFFLEGIRRLELAGLYYGALDMTRDGVTPVLCLDGLFSIQRWVAAMNRFDATGDYGVFASLLVRDGVSAHLAECLEAAAFHERTFNLKDARRKLQSFRPALNSPLPGASGLFQQRLLERLQWIDDAEPHMWQQRLAYIYLDRGDFVRAAVLAWEAIVLEECARGNFDPDDYGEQGERRHATKVLDQRLDQEGGGGWKRSPQKTINDLRNALAHGSRPKRPDLKTALHDPRQLREILLGAMKEAFGASRKLDRAAR